METVWSIALPIATALNSQQTMHVILQQDQPPVRSQVYLYRPALFLQLVRNQVVPPNLLLRNPVSVRPPVRNQVVYMHRPVLFLQLVRNQVVTPNILPQNQVLVQPPVHNQVVYLHRPVRFLQLARNLAAPPNLLPHNQVPVQPPVCNQVVYPYHPVRFRRQVGNQVAPPNLLPGNRVPVQQPVHSQGVYLYHPVLFRRQVRNQVVTPNLLPQNPATVLRATGASLQPRPRSLTRVLAAPSSCQPATPMCSGLVRVLVQVETIVLFFDIPLSEIVLGSTVGKGTMAGGIQQLGEEAEGTEGEEEVEGGERGEDIDPTIRREPTGPVETTPMPSPAPVVTPSPVPYVCPLQSGKSECASLMTNSLPTTDPGCDCYNFCDGQFSMN